MPFGHEFASATAEKSQYKTSGCLYLYFTQIVIKFCQKTSVYICDLCPDPLTIDDRF